MNYAEEQLQNAMENELEAIKLRNSELVSENEKLEEDNINLANEKDDFSIQVRTLTNVNKELKGNLEFERTMYSNLKDKCKDLEIELQKEISKSKRIIKDLTSYL